MSEKILNLTKDNFKDTIKEGLTLVDFWAPWCGPCRMQLPILESLADKLGEKAKIAKVNVDNEQQLAVDYSVQSIPSIFLFKNGKPVKNFIGVQQASTLEEVIQENL
jgi:thioredoxin 1